ncbi:hypothetical protein [Nonomuraea dietziae]
MTTPDPGLEPTSITARWEDAEVPVKVTATPEQPVAGWIDEPAE